MVLGLAAGLVARQAERGQVGTQHRQRLLVQEAAEVVRAVEEHLRLADAEEQRVVLLRRRGRRGGAHRRHQRRPRRLEKGARLRRLRHGDARTAASSASSGAAQPQPREQAVQLGARQFFAVVGRGEAQRGQLVAS